MADPAADPTTAPPVLTEIQSGEGLSLAAAGRLFPGHRGGRTVDPSTVFRWVTKGTTAGGGPSNSKLFVPGHGGSRPVRRSAGSSPLSPPRRPPQPLVPIPRPPPGHPPPVSVRRPALPQHSRRWGREADAGRSGRIGRGELAGATPRGRWGRPGTLSTTRPPHGRFPRPTPPPGGSGTGAPLPTGWPTGRGTGWSSGPTGGAGTMRTPRRGRSRSARDRSGSKSGRGSSTVGCLPGTSAPPNAGTSSAGTP